jgi:acyl carrier protein
MSDELASIETKVRSFITDELLDGKRPVEFGSDTELVETGIVDSVNVLNLVEFIEESYNIELEVADIQKFTTLGNIAGGIARKLAQRS